MSEIWPQRSRPMRDLYSPAVVVHDLIAYRQKGVDSSRVVIPMSSVRSVVVRQANEEATGWLIVSGVVVAGLVAGAIALHNTCFACGAIGGWSR